MKNKTWVRRQEIRYSEAFKMEVVRELESEGLGFDDLAMKYGIKGKTTVARCASVWQWHERNGDSRAKTRRDQ